VHPTASPSFICDKPFLLFLALLRHPLETWTGGENACQPKWPKWFRGDTSRVTSVLMPASASDMRVYSDQKWVGSLGYNN
jgi:hypothetical protein